MRHLKVIIIKIINIEINFFGGYEFNLKFYTAEWTRKVTPVFSPAQEIELVKYLKDCEARLFGLSSFETRVLAHQLAEKNEMKHSFVNGVAGEDWLRGFLKRNPTSSFRKPESTSIDRAARFNRVVPQNFFSLLEQITKKHNLKPERIFNVDETGISSVPKTHGKILAEKGKKQVGILTSAERGKNVTVELCVSASGEFLPPLFILPRQRMKESLLKGTLPGSWGLCHPSGWIQTDIFFNWFKWFVDRVKPTAEDPVLLILDGHKTHTNNLDLIDYARNHHVIIICLPPHCTHRLQPLDVSVMKSISSCYEKEVKNWLSSHPGRVVTPETIPKLFSDALRVAAKPETIRNGFRKAGIYPMNPNVFRDKDFAPADVTNNNSLATTSDNCATLLEMTPDEPVLEQLTQSLSGLMNSKDIEENEIENTITEEPMPSTSTGTSSLRPRVGFFRPRVIDSDSDEEPVQSHSNHAASNRPLFPVHTQSSQIRLVDYSSSSDEEGNV